MAKPALSVEHLLNAEELATSIANKWQTWNSMRSGWLEEKRELRNYVYATDTSTTSNNKLPWSNSTTTPKLTQIYDNLKANYSATLFPNSNWMRWEAIDGESDTRIKRDAIQGYMEAKVRQSDFEYIMDKCLDDYILYGNTFATVEYANESTELESGEIIQGYTGPRVVRISPYDICFDPTASSFKHSPKVIRSVVTLGELQREMEDGKDEYKAIFDKILDNRHQVVSAGSTEKSDGFVADGFGSLEAYYTSDYVELLTFYGDIYDLNSGGLKRNRMITVVDRAYVVKDEVIPSWLGSAPVFHAGWRSRPDNLYAMGPLDNLVGMQYRIDHLENLKADVFDVVALPMTKVRGEVEDFEYGPGERIIMGEEGDVSFMAPDTTALNADFQIQTLENKMEEMAGAPRQAMGIRTPGEKTAFEVQSLQNSASRIFQHKSAQLERDFIEHVLNAMLEAGRRNLIQQETISLTSDEGKSFFATISKADIVANGKIKPVGARHFAERATRVQNLNQMLQIKAMDPTIGTHMSGKEIARIIAEELGEPSIFKDNVSVTEATETQRAAQNAEADALEELEIQAEMGI
jgi:hypothetical protein